MLWHCYIEEILMGFMEKLKNAVQDLQGKGKEAAGGATNDRSLQAKGQSEQSRAAAKRARENIKDVFKD